MAALNAKAAAAAVAAGASAMTDVTGFGLLGHLHGLARESGVAARVDAGAVPVVDGARAVLEDERGLSGGSRRNREYADGFTSFDPGVASWRARLVCDATTSGGLLVAVDPARAGGVPGAVVGQLVDGEPGTIAVV
jgi:selenide, water dikinase